MFVTLSRGDGISDSILEAFFRWLGERVGQERLLLFLTADHGVTPIPEVAREKARRSTGRDDPAAAGRSNLMNVRGDSSVRDVGADRMALERHLAKVFRYELLLDRPNISEAAVVWFDDGYLYLNKPILARRGLPVEKVKAKARDFLRGLPGVRAAYTNTELLDGLAATEPNAVAIERSFRADRAGDLLVVLKPGWVWYYEKPAGTSHGQPTEDDMRVPLLAWGAGVKAGSWDLKVSPISIARTVGALFGFEVGEPDAAILEPVLGRDMRLAKPQ